jgi:hypothetical protein
MNSTFRHHRDGLTCNLYTRGLAIYPHEISQPPHVNVILQACTDAPHTQPSSATLPTTYVTGQLSKLNLESSMYSPYPSAMQLFHVYAGKKKKNLFFWTYYWTTNIGFFINVRAYQLSQLNSDDLHFTSSLCFPVCSWRWQHTLTVRPKNQPVSSD